MTVSRAGIFSSFKSRSRTVGLVLAGAMMLGGCAGTTGEMTYDEAIPVNAMTRPLDMSVVCVLDNEKTAFDRVQLAIEEGIRRFDAEPRFLPLEAGPQACSMVVTYEIRGKNGKMLSIHYQTYENSIPKIQAHGSYPDGRELTFDSIANYTLQLLRKTKDRRVQGILTGDFQF